MLVSTIGRSLVLDVERQPLSGSLALGYRHFKVAAIQAKAAEAASAACSPGPAVAIVGSRGQVQERSVQLGGAIALEVKPALAGFACMAATFK